MNNDHIRAQIRGTATEDGLLATFDAGEQAHVSTIEAAIPGGNAFDASRVAQTLRDLGLAEQWSSLAGEVTLTHNGRVLAQKIKQSRLNGPERWDAVERAIIADLIERRMRNANDWGVLTVDGKDVDDAERANAMQRLSDWGYLTGVSVAEADGFVRIDVTPKAAQVAGIDGFLEDHHNAGGGSSHHFSNSTTFGDGNTIGAVQTGGQGNTAKVLQNITTDLRAQVLAEVGGLLRSLDKADGDTTDLRASVEAVRDEAASDEATRTSLKDRVVNALVVAGASESGHLITQGLAHVLGVVTG